MDNRFLGLIGLFALLLFASCEVESVEEQEELFTISSSEGSTTSPKDGKD